MEPLSFMPTVRARLPRILAKLGTEITLTWTEWTGSTIDPVTGSREGGTPQTLSATIRGLVHAAEAKSVIRQHSEIEVGDLIVDLAPDAPIDGKEALEFTIDGQKYRQKEMGERLAKAWDVVLSNQRFYRTVLLRKAT